MVNSLDGININNPFENKLDKIIEYFVEFYGEKYRERITNRLKNTIFIFVDSLSRNRIKFANKYFEQQEETLLNEFAQDASKILNIEGPSNLNFNFLSNLEAWATEIKEEDYASVYMFLKGLAGQEIPDNSFKDMEKTFKNAYNSDKNQINSVIKALSQLYKENYEQKFLSLINEKNAAITPANESRMYQSDKKMCDDYSLTVLRNYLKPLFKIKNIDDFLPTIKNWILKGSKSLTKDEIQKINDLESLVKMNFKQMESIIFSDKITKKLQELEERLNMKLSSYVNNYIDNLLEFYNSEILFKDDILMSITQYIKFNECAGFISPTISINNQNQTTNVCVLSTFFALVDSCAVHELNHIVESTNSLKNDVFYSKTGFAKMKKYVNKDEPDFQNNELNEIFNDYISIKIHNLMVRDNFKMGGIEFAKSLYSYAFPAFEKLIEENLDDIIASRMSDDPDAFAKIIGQENFNKLSDIASDMLHQVDRRDFKSAMKEINLEINQKAPNKELHKISLNNDWSENTRKYLQNVKLAEKIRKDIKSAKKEKDLIKNEANQENEA